MNFGINQSTLQLSKSFRNNLETYREEWIDLTSRSKNGDHNPEKFVSGINKLFVDAGQKPPKIVTVSSVWQLTNIPLIISLMVTDNSKIYLDTIRESLNDKSWKQLFDVFDRQISAKDIEALKIKSDKSHQASTLKEINRFMRRLHESTGTTFDTQESPKLSSIGLQINSRFLAEAKSLMISLDSELKNVVPEDCIEEIKKELSSISSVYERLETQLGLQIIPNILASSVREIKTQLVQNHGDLLKELKKNSSSMSDLMKLIYQADLENKVNNLRTTELWGGARIGAYGDPAVRLIASSLQLDVFRQSILLNWLPVHLYMRKKLPDLYSKEIDEKLSCWENILDSAYAFVIYDNICFVCQHPKSQSFDEEGRYHNESKPSIIFDDGTEVFSWHGRNVPRHIIEQPEDITIEMIDRERNIEIRTILIDRYGISKFLEDSGARVIQQDEYGTLFERHFTNDEPLLVVMVKNSTPEPDGTYKHYFLRVPPTTLTAKAGIAWTFSLSEDEYDPNIQT